MVRILGVKPLGSRNVELTLSDGRTVVRDLKPLMFGEVFADLLADDQRFGEVSIDGGTLAWPGGVDLCPDVLIWGGLPPLAELSLNGAADSGDHANVQQSD